MNHLNHLNHLNNLNNFSSLSNIIKTILMDADDTLWKNNCYYEEAIKSFAFMMEEKGLIPSGAESVLRKQEIENVRHYGYGSRSFTLSMLDVYEEACLSAGREKDSNEVNRIKEIGHSTGYYPITLMEGVEETLPHLYERNCLILVTKGSIEEQRAKVERSRIAHYFLDVRIVSEKDKDTYLSITQEFELDPNLTWMVGNSPKSDINPAKAAGLGTVLIPCSFTWEHEMEQLSQEGRETIVLDSFALLKEHF